MVPPSDGSGASLSKTAWMGFLPATTALKSADASVIVRRSPSESFETSNPTNGPCSTCGCVVRTQLDTSSANAKATISLIMGSEVWTGEQGSAYQFANVRFG